MTLSAEDILQMDYDDPLKEYKDKFQLPNGIIYMDGNSLGAMPKNTQDVINNTAGSQTLACSGDSCEIVDLV